MCYGISEYTYYLQYLLRYISFLVRMERAAQLTRLAAGILYTPYRIRFILPGNQSRRTNTSSMVIFKYFLRHQIN